MDEMDLDDVRRMARAYTPRAFATLIKQTNDPDVAKAAQKVLLDYTHLFQVGLKSVFSQISGSGKSWKRELCLWLLGFRHPLFRAINRPGIAARRCFRDRIVPNTVRCGPRLRPLR